MLHRALSHNDTDTRGAAALALKHLCDATAGHLATFLEPLMQLYAMALNSAVEMKGTAVVGPGIATPVSSVGKGMDAEDVIQIIEGVSYVVSALPVDQADPVLSAMLRPIATPLLQIFPEEPVAVPPEANVVIVHFDRLAAVMRYVSHPELVASIFRELWPVVQRGLENCGNRDERATEHICRCIKYAFRTARWGDVRICQRFVNALCEFLCVHEGSIPMIFVSFAPYVMSPAHGPCCTCRGFVHEYVFETPACESAICC